MQDFVGEGGEPQWLKVSTFVQFPEGARGLCPILGPSAGIFCDPFGFTPAAVRSTSCLFENDKGFRVERAPFRAERINQAAGVISFCSTVVEHHQMGTLCQSELQCVGRGKLRLGVMWCSERHQVLIMWLEMFVLRTSTNCG